MESSLNFHKDLMIRQHLKEMRASRPDLNFQQAWAWCGKLIRIYSRLRVALALGKTNRREVPVQEVVSYVQ